jgi:hypothetical protein
MKKLLLAAAGMLLLSGCQLLVSSTQDELQKLQDGKQDLNFLVYKSGAILACVKGVGGSCANSDAAADAVNVRAPLPGMESKLVAEVVKDLNPSSAADAPPSTAPVLSAAAAITNQTYTKLEILFQKAAGIDTSGNKVEFSKTDLMEFGKSIHEATSLNGWTQLSSRILSNPPADVATADATVAQLTLLDAYLSAYFSNGHFLSLDVAAKDFKEHAVAQIKNKKLGLSDDEINKIVDKAANSLAGKQPDKDGVYHLVSKIDDGGFVTRAGTKYAFTGVSVTLDPVAAQPVQVSKIDFTQVGADVVRIFLEAMADEANQLPGATASTACVVYKRGALAKHEDLCFETQPRGLKAEDSDKVNERANQVESATSTITGQAIRGISWISLNNEALAKLIETAVGVAARKATEKVTWCYYACRASSSGKADMPAPQAVPVQVTIKQ